MIWDDQEGRGRLKDIEILNRFHGWFIEDGIRGRYVILLPSP